MNGFGFFGKSVAVHDFEGHGQLIGGTIRFFGFTLVVPRPSFVRKERMIFDLDAVGPTPNFSYKTSLGNVAYDNNSQYNTIIETSASFQGGATGGTLIGHPTFYRYGNAWSGVGFNSAAVLSPATRKFRLKVGRPDLVSGFLLNTINGSGNNATTNLQSVSPFTLDLRQYANLKFLYLTTGIFVANATIKLHQNSKLENFFITSSAVTSLSITLPSTTKVIQIGSSLTTVSSNIANCTACEVLTFGHPAGGYTGLTNQTNTLSGALDISHMSGLKVFTLPQNNNLTSVVLPTGNTNWVWVHMNNISASVRSSISTTVLSEILATSSLNVFVFFNNQLSWSKAIVDTDLPNAGAYVTFGNSISGNITLTTSRPNLLEFRTSSLASRTGIQQNSHPTVNITGLTAATVIDLTGSDVDNLTLPVNTVCQQLYLFDNELDVTVNTNLVSQINAMTGLITVYLGSNSASNSESAVRGQSSTNGFGNNLSLSGLINATAISVASCKLTGTLTLPNVNKLTSLFLSFNHDLSAIANLTSHTGLVNITAYNCENLSFAITNAFTAISQILISDTGVTAIDLTGKTTGSMNELQCSNCDALTTITFSATAARMIFGSPRTITGANSATLSSIVNMDQVSFNAKTFGVNTWAFENCILDITFPFGANDFCPNAITIQNNAMSQANVDATITSLYNNKTKWATYTIAKTMNIAGTNAAPTGTYQAPAGFSLGVSDGTPASVKEMVYVLVNNYSWTITMN